MFTSLMEGFAPWSVVLPIALFRDYKLNRHIQTNNASIKLLLWLWVAAVVVFFSFSRGKCDYYVLPCYPAAAVLVGACINELIDKVRRLKLATVLRALPAVVFCTICGGGIIFAYTGLRTISNMMGTSQVSPLIKQLPKDTQIGVYSSYASGIDEITFQTGREQTTITTTEQLVDFLNQKDKPALVVVPENVFEAAPDIHCMRGAKKLDAIWLPVTPGSILRRQGLLIDPVPTVLVVNY
jgi:hypothetical protein